MIALADRNRQAARVHKTVIVSVSMPDWALRELDKHAEAVDRTRSALLWRAAIEWIRTHTPPKITP